MFESIIGRVWLLAPVTISSLFLSLGLIVLLRPWLARHALAYPTTRSSHHAPTPQGGGIAVISAAILVSWCAVAFQPLVVGDQALQLVALTAAIILLAVVGAIDDMRSLGATPRLVMQCIAVG